MKIVNRSRLNPTGGEGVDSLPRLRGVRAHGVNS